MTLCQTETFEISGLLVHTGFFVLENTGQELGDDDRQYSKHTERLPVSSVGPFQPDQNAEANNQQHGC